MFMQIVEKPIQEIFPYEKNPRKNTKAIDVVANSLKQYGFQQPIVVDANNIIIVGHTRYQAAKKLGMKQVPVLTAGDLTEKQVKAYRIMDNKSSEFAKWDDSLLMSELTDLIQDNNLQIVSEDTGFTESELNKLFPDDSIDLMEKYSHSDKFVSQQGDIWMCGNHRIICGDSTDPNNIDAVLEGQMIDVIWEDPPYGISYETANGINYSKEENELRNHKIANDNLSEMALDEFLNKHYKILTERVKPGGNIYVAHDIRFTQQIRDMISINDYHIADTLIWRKNNASNWLSNYAKYYEPIIYGWKKGAESRWYGKGMQPNAVNLDDLDEMSKEQIIKLIRSIPSNYVEIPKEPRSVASLHPTVKPVKLILYHLYNSSRPNDIIFDGFGGSGSTLIACEKSNRRCRMVEYERKFVDTAIRRWQDLTGETAMRQSDNKPFDEVQPS